MPERMRRRVAVLVLAVSAAGIAFAATRPDPVSPFPAAVEACGLGANSNVEVAARTLSIHGDGEHDPGLHSEAMACLLVEAGVPLEVSVGMDQTGSSDGLRSVEWDGGGAEWRRYPGGGVDVTLTWGGS